MEGKFPKAKAFALLAIGFDHSPILLLVFPKQEAQKKEFKFEAYCLEDEEFEEIVSNIWLDSNHNQGELVRKLEKVAKELTILSRRKFSNVHCQIEALKRQLMEFTNSLVQKPTQ